MSDFFTRIAPILDELKTFKKQLMSSKEVALQHIGRLEIATKELQKLREENERLKAEDFNLRKQLHLLQRLPSPPFGDTDAEVKCREFHAADQSRIATLEKLPFLATEWVSCYPTQDPAERVRRDKVVSDARAALRGENETALKLLNQTMNDLKNSATKVGQLGSLLREAHQVLKGIHFPNGSFDLVERISAALEGK